MTTILAKPSGEESGLDIPAGNENFISPQPGTKLGNTVPAPPAPAPQQPAPEQKQPQPDPAPAPEARPTTGEILNTLQDMIRTGAITTPQQLQDQLALAVRGKFNPATQDYRLEVNRLLGSIYDVVAASTDSGIFEGDAQQRDQAFIDLIRNRNPE